MTCRINNKFYYVDKKAMIRPETKMRKERRFPALKLRHDRMKSLVGDTFFDKEFITQKKTVHDERPSRLRRTRNMPNHKLFHLVVAYITNTEDDEIFKETLAYQLRVKEHAIEKCFHQLNLLGILSQRRPRYAHDTNRNPIFGGSDSGWHADTYKILDKQKARELLKTL